MDPRDIADYMEGPKEPVELRRLRRKTKATYKLINDYIEQLLGGYWNIDDMPPDKLVSMDIAGLSDISSKLSEVHSAVFSAAHRLEAKSSGSIPGSEYSEPTET